MVKKSETPEIVAAEKPAAASAPVVETAPSPAPVADAPSAIEPTASVTALTPNLAAQRALADRLPAKYREDVLLLKRPSSEELLNIVTALPTAQQDKMMMLVAKTRPKKQGVHTTATGFAPTSLKLFHGVGADPARPKTTLPGQYYGSDSRVVGEKFTAVPLGFYQGRILWPPQGAGGDNASKAPICVSADRTTGSKYGACGSCALGSKPYTQGGCTLEVTFWVLDEDMTSIYELKFNKSSYGAGESLVKILMKSENIWDRWFTFETQERTEDSKRWYVQKASPLVDTKSPDRTNSDKVLHPLFSALSKVLDADVYFPMLADINDRSKASPEKGTAAAPVENFDEKAFLASDTGDSPDYSKTSKDV